MKGGIIVGTALTKLEVMCGAWWVYYSRSRRDYVNPTRNMLTKLDNISPGARDLFVKCADMVQVSELGGGHSSSRTRH